jgi:hypothetical protein
MKTLIRMLSFAALGLCSGAVLAATSEPQATEVKARWQVHKLDLDYVGLTARYSCDGIEDKVKAFLGAYGARKGMKVRAFGCDMTPGHFDRFATVRGEFEVLVPADESATDTVAARWQPLELRANRPFEMGEGDCELFEQLRPTLEKVFAQRDASYVTHCTPYQVGLGSWSIKAQVLRPAQP